MRIWVLRIENSFLSLQWMKCNIIYIVWCIVALLVSCEGAGSVHGERKEELLTQPVVPEHRLRLLFAGDAMCHYPQIVAARQADGILNFRESFAAMKPYFDRADIAVVNLETTISPDAHYSGYPTFASPVEYAEALAWVGMDVALLANNHCCDRGRRGVHSTVATLDRLGVAHTGAFADEDDYARNRVLRIEHNGIKLAILNYTFGTNGISVPQGCVVNMIDTTRMVADLDIAIENSDCVIACMHWGDEYSRRPSREQRRLAEFLHRHGVDVVVGSHPHVVQPAKADGKSVTIYSLGNFVSNQRKRYCDGGVVAEVEVVKDAEGECRYSLVITPVWVAMPGYHLLPPEQAGKEVVSAAQRADYERFMLDTEQLFVRGLR